MHYDYEDALREQDAKRAEGYECQKCGYVPTWKEVNRGSCPMCPTRKHKAEDSQPADE